MLAVGLPALLAVFAANHVEHGLRRRRLKAAAAAAGSLVVRSEGTLAGHSQIGIDEASLGEAAGRERALLRFGLLGQWDYDPGKPADCPAAVRELSGRRASCVGFMYPLEAGPRLRMFCLLRTTQTCCYGPRPQYNQYLLVEMKEPVRFERLAPVLVVGRFLVDPQPEEGYIYRMEGESVVPAAEDEPETDPAQAAAREGAALFDFAALAAAESQPAPAGPPAELLALDGRAVVVGGFVLAREDGPAPRVVVGRDWWDGRSAGRPPTAFTALTAFLKTARDLPPVWKQRDVFVGTLRVNRERAAWSRRGVVSLQEATRVSGAEGRRGLAVEGGPLLPVCLEALLLAAFGFLCFGRRPKPAGRAEGG